jgi:polysaccharide biosynthesis/export protein
MKPYRFAVYVLLSAYVLFLSACGSSRKAIYFSQNGKSEFPAATQSLEPVIQPNDLLSITVTSLNPQASEVFNSLNATADRPSTATATTSQATGYLVDTEGNIKLPYLGEIKAAGLTKKALQDGIRNEILRRKLLLDPIVDIRYLNYKVSVLGEVARPSVLTVPNEKITFLEALGLAGDLTIFANRDNVLLIREEEGKKMLHRIDLTSNELFTSPYYYLKSNDIIYVEPNKAKISNASGARTWLPVILSALSLAVVSIDLLTR